MNKDLQVGQRVRLSEDSYWIRHGSGNNPTCVNGVMVGFAPTGWVIVRWDSGYDNRYCPTDSDLIPVEATADSALETLV